MSDFQGAFVLVTGGAAGLGRLFAERSLAEGAARIALWDIDEQSLMRATEQLRAEGHAVEPRVVDVSVPAEIEQAASAMIDEMGPPDVLFNNAGVVVGKAFHQHSAAEIERTIRINTLGPMHVARAFLPAMIERGSGHFVNIASASSYLPNPNMSVYASSKWAVLGWSETLRLELEQLNPNLRVTTAAPGYIDTGMFHGVSAPLLTPIMKPERIVAKIMRAVKKNKIVVRAPFTIVFLPVLRGILPPRVFDVVVGRLFGAYRTMDTFVGHSADRA